MSPFCALPTGPVFEPARARAAEYFEFDWRQSSGILVIGELEFGPTCPTDLQILLMLSCVVPPGECYYHTLLCCDYFSYSVVSHAFCVLRMYSKFGHHPHPKATFVPVCFFCGLWRKITYSINHPAYLMLREPKRLRFGIDPSAAADRRIRRRKFVRRKNYGPPN